MLSIAPLGKPLLRPGKTVVLYVSRLNPAASRQQRNCADSCPGAESWRIFCGTRCSSAPTCKARRRGFTSHHFPLTSNSVSHSVLLCTRGTVAFAVCSLWSVLCVGSAFLFSVAWRVTVKVTASVARGPVQTMALKKKNVSHADCSTLKSTIR